jgi:hypothetical protein
MLSLRATRKPQHSSGQSSSATRGSIRAAAAAGMMLAATVTATTTAIEVPSVMGIERRNAEQQVAEPEGRGHGQRESCRHARGAQVEALT